MKEANHLTDGDREKIMDAVAQVKAAGAKSVGVRPASYTGEPHPIAAITTNGGASLHGFVYR